MANLLTILDSLEEAIPELRERLGEEEEDMEGDELAALEASFGETASEDDEAPVDMEVDMEVAEDEEEPPFEFDEEELDIEVPPKKKKKLLPFL